jgi:hypothetical protein
MINYPIFANKLNHPRCFHTYFKRERLETLLEKNSDKIDTLVSQWVKNKRAVWVSCYEDMDSNEQIDVLSAKRKLGYLSINLLLNCGSIFFLHNLINSRC